MYIAALLAQSSPPVTVPEGSPFWWGLVVSIAVGAAATVWWLIRRYVDHRLKISASRNTLEVKREESEISRASNLTDALHDMADSNRELAESNRAITAELSAAYKQLAADRAEASREREIFHNALEQNTAALRGNIAGLQSVKDQLIAVDGTLDTLKSEVAALISRLETEAVATEQSPAETPTV